MSPSATPDIPVTMTKRAPRRATSGDPRLMPVIEPTDDAPMTRPISAVVACRASRIAGVRVTHVATAIPAPKNTVTRAERHSLRLPVDVVGTAAGRAVVGTAIRVLLGECSQLRGCAGLRHYPHGRWDRSQPLARAPRNVHLLRGRPRTRTHPCRTCESRGTSGEALSGEVDGHAHPGDGRPQGRLVGVEPAQGDANSPRTARSLCRRTRSTSRMIQSTAVPPTSSQAPPSTHGPQPRGLPPRRPDP